jgi:hypothetical protein
VSQARKFGVRCQELRACHRHVTQRANVSRRSAKPHGCVRCALIRGVHRWSDLHVVARDGQIVARITHTFSDPIEELSGLCCGLLRGETQCMTRLHDEPGATILIASIHAKQKHAAHIEFWDCEFWDCQNADEIPRRGKSILSVDIKVRQFVGLIYRQLEKVRWLYEERSYRKNRGPFPHVAFETLQRLWMQQSHYRAELRPPRLSAMG